MLVGRGPERASLERLTERARAGHGGALVLRGEAGAGKSALLEDAVEQARGMTILRACGVPSEATLPFAGLLDLLRPVLDRMPALPPPQARALAGALALAPFQPGDRFAVYAATLGLLAQAADEGPVLAVVDDAHWVDAASMEALLFAARRVASERVGLLFAARESEAAAFDWSGIPALAVGGLGREGGLALLARTAPGLAPAVAEQMVAATAGNPLALLEVPALLSPGQRAGTEPLEDPLPAGGGAERAFLRRIGRLAPPARTALLVAAASSSLDLDVIRRALAVLGLDDAALEAAESGQLIALRGRTVQFRHPLVRSSAYHAAALADRRAAHRALAAALREAGAEERSAWHLAAAAVGPDEDVAAALESAARAARARSGYAAAAAAFERAAELTPAGEQRARRLLAAAEAWQPAGRAARAVKILQEASATAGDAVLRAAIHHALGRIDTWRGPAGTAADRLTAEAARIERVAPDLAARMLTDAVTARIVVCDFAGAVATGRRAYEAARALGGAPELEACLQLGKALILHGEAAAGHPMIMRCRELLAAPDPLANGMALAHCAPALMSVEEYATARELLDRLIAAARAAGGLSLLAYCLGALAELDARTGRWTSAYAHGFESVQLAREAGLAGQLSYNLARLARLEAAQGREDACRTHAQQALELADEFGFDSSVVFAESALGLLELGLGHAEAAAGRLHELARVIEPLETKEPGRLEWTPDLIEACIRAGDPARARPVLDRFEHRARATNRAMALAAAHRCRGLLAGVGEYEECFASALAWHERSHTPFERARTQLCFGERLRRARRRAHARDQLRAAIAAFDRLGARPWAERARSELRASGETARKRDPSTAEQLTAQELQVALAVARGATNREAAAALFVSPKTIESHLHSAFRKLNVRSRTELARVVLAYTADPPQAPVGARQTASARQRSALA